MKIIVSLVLCTILARQLSAGTYVLTTQGSDGAVNGSYAIDSVTGTTANVGTSPSNGYGHAAIFVFSMPKIPFGEYISGATFKLNLASTVGSGFTFNGDLVSLGVSSSPSVVGTDYYNGSYGTAPNSTLIQQHFLTPGTALGSVATNAAGNSAIAADLNAWRTAGANPSDFYFLRVNPDFTSFGSATAGYNLSMTEDAAARQPALSVQTATAPQLGRVLFEYWTGIAGTAVSSLTTSANYPNKPSSREYPTVLEIPANLDTNSGDRMRCYFYPPVTGSYTFALASDDNSVLLFSLDGAPADAAQVAAVTSPTSYHGWGTSTNGQQYAVTLTAGQKYYLETQHKKGTSSTGASNLSLGWNPPAGVSGSGSVNLMPATYCAPYDAGAAYSTDAISNLIQPLVHPRLMISPAAILRLVNEVTTGSAQYNAAQAASWASVVSIVSGTGRYTTPNFEPVQGPLIGATYVQTGIPATQSNLIVAARTLQDRVYYLSLFYQMESLINPSDPNLPKALTQIYGELQNAANWGSSVTNPAAGTLTGKWDAYQFLDLPEVSHPFAIAYDWCYAGWTTAQRGFLVDAISRLALGESDGGNGQHGGTSQLKASYFSSSSNWTEVCNSGLMFSAIAVLGDESTYLPASPNPSDTQQAPTILNTLIPAYATTNGMTEWAPDGGWPEGMGYWAFATRYLFTLYACMETSAGTCFNLDKLSGMSSAGSFLFYGTGPTGLTFNFADAGTGTYSCPWAKYMGLKYNQPVYSYPENVQGGTGGMYPLDMLWLDTRIVPPAAPLPTSTYFSNAGVISLRSAWGTKDALFAGIKAGYNSNGSIYGSGHSMLQIGTFVFDALGVRWAEDLGSDNYGLGNYFTTNPWTNPNRWQYYRARAEGNNTLVINPSLDGGQTYSGTATITDFETNANLQQAIIDMTPAYATTDGNPSSQVAAATPVTSVKRGMRFINGVAQLQDEIISVTSAGTLVSNPGVWAYQSLPAQTATFTATFDAAASAVPNNGIIGFSNGVQNAYTSYACIARFNPSGNIDAYNGTAYAAATTIPYTVNATYHFRMVVNIASQTYSVYVTPPGGTEITVGVNDAFRLAASTLNEMADYVAPTSSGGNGTLTVANFMLNGQAPASGVDLNWFMHTARTVSVSGNVATLTPSSGTSRLQMIIQSPSGATFATMGAVPLPTSPNPSGQSTNSTYSKLWIHLPSTTSTTVTVALCPYVQGNTPPVPPAVIPLSGWPAAAATPTPSFSQWEAKYFTATQLNDPTTGGATATPQNDGISNLLKYVLDINPAQTMKASDAAVLPSASLTTTGGNTYLTLRYRQNPSATGITINVQTTADLRTWQTAIPNSIQNIATDSATGDPIVQMQFQVVPNTPREFIRLNVTQP